MARERKDTEHARWATFDCYGTLIDWESGISATLERLWPHADIARLLDRYHRIEPQVQAGSAIPYRAVMAESLRRLAAEEGLPLDPGKEQALGDSLPSWRPFAEVPAALAELRRRGWRLALLSNSDPELLAASARQIGVQVDLMVSAAEAGSYKPAHGHWLRFWELSGVTPGRHVHVAVSLFHDIAPAAELGVPAVWINRPEDVTNRIDGRTMPAYAAELADLSPLPDTLDRLVAGQAAV